jgi:Ser/Thr protein kinase RdoA (MazF antagonist)
LRDRFAKRQTHYSVTLSSAREDPRTDAREAEFVSTIRLLFDLGDGQTAVITPISGSANRLWRLDTAQGAFAIKEFRYTTDDKRWLAAVRRAAEFEFEVWETSRVPMAYPIRATDGAIVHVIIGSRGSPAAVRLHRWLEGTPVPRPVAVPTAAAAGSLLSDIHRLGSRFANSDRGTLRWWRWDPAGILFRLQQFGLLDPRTAEVGRAALSDADRLIAAGEATLGRWIFSHYDHKPENALAIGETLAVLDWDESALCHPRLETVESALRWAGIAEGKVHADAFAAFVESYRDRGGQLGDLIPSDFAKWVASMVGWFEYLGRRALREFDDSDAEAASAAEAAAAAISSLGQTLAELRTWRPSGYLPPFCFSAVRQTAPDGAFHDPLVRRFQVKKH